MGGVRRNYFPTGADGTDGVGRAGASRKSLSTGVPMVTFPSGVTGRKSILGRNVSRPSNGSTGRDQRGHDVVELTAV